jgi:hypothetical protein
LSKSGSDIFAISVPFNLILPSTILPGGCNILKKALPRLLFPQADSPAIPNDSPA